MRDLTAKTGLNQSTVARTLSHLGDKPLRGHKHPLRWIETHPDPVEPRRVRVHLSDIGRKLLDEIETIME